MIDFSQEQKKVIHDLFVNNSTEYNIDKLLEELAELSTAILQARNKTSQSNDDILKHRQAMIDEIGDVQIRLAVYSETFKNTEIESRIDKKLSKFDEYLRNRKYKNV
jgi:predicted  nucleic acid-binding Zn-ribbon protein